MERFVQVALKVAHNDGIFTYLLKDASRYGQLIGKRVAVTLRSRQLTGVIIGEQERPAEHLCPKIKEVIQVIDDQPVILDKQLELMKFCAHYYFNDLGSVVHLAVPRNEKAPKAIKAKISKAVEQPLTKAQSLIADTISNSCSHAFLLEGVTGSGKTHVYIEVAKRALAKGQSVLFLVPEISLTPQLVNRVHLALGESALVMHSNITPAKKRDHIFSLLNGARVLIGARSAIFAPLKNLGLIVVDEEHDNSLKQDESPRYNARDLALWRGKNEGARVILGSATPSLESIVNTHNQKLVHLTLSERFNHTRSMPKVEVIDLKERSSDVDFRTQDQSQSAGQKMCILSRPLVLEMKKTLAKGAQVLLFLNQRGYARFGVCHDCGQMVSCPNCSVGLTYYQARQTLLCHQCQHVEKQSTTCRQCLKDSIRFLGLGTERLESEVKQLFPDSRVLRLDRDAVRSQKRLEHTLEAMHDRSADILIGTQMIAKGHDFLHVGLVGVVLADIALSMPDFRAAEKTFQLLTQVAGRAGRGQIEGKAMIQTFDPSHPSVRFAKDHNVTDFIAQELRARKIFLNPPFSRAALVRCEHIDREVSEGVIKAASDLLKSNAHLSILGPAPSTIEKINNRFRFQCMVMTKSSSTLHNALAAVLAHQGFAKKLSSSRARFAIDVDPYNLC